MNKKNNDNPGKLTDAVLNSYLSDERTQRIGQLYLPSRQRIVEILDELRRLIFPGYFGHKKLSERNIHSHVENLLAKIKKDLLEEVTHCLCSQRECTECDSSESTQSAQCYQAAAEMVREFLERIPKIRSLLALDAQAAYDGDPAAKSIDEVIYCYPGFFAVAVYRIAHELDGASIPLMPRIMSEHAHSVTGTDIHPGATIGKSFFIDHATGVIIGETTEIGDNVKIYQGVTLGGMSFPKDERGRVIKGLKRHPTIEDNVTIYANATILGGDTVIGKGTTVNGNVFITKSITPESIVTPKHPKLRVHDGKK